MTSASTTRRLYWLLAVTVCIALATFVALPWVASTQLVRDRIAVELSEWSGYRITMGGAPKIDVWPRFTATLSDVRFSEWDEQAKTPIIKTESLEIDLSPWAVLKGDIEFSHARFHKPELRVGTTSNGYALPSLPITSRLAQSIAQAKLARALNPENPGLAALPIAPFGVIEIVDGTVIVDTAAAQQILLGGLSATIDWPELSGTGSFRAKGIWRGQRLSVAAQSDQPLLLLGGDEASFSAELKSQLLTASFEGSVEPRKRKLSGTAQAETPAVRDAMLWLDKDAPAGIGALPVKISARIEGEKNHLNLDRLQIDVAGNAGIGALELSETDDQPALAGTMAFRTLDLPSALTLFASDATAASGTPRTLSNWRKWLALDVRVSAATASAWGTGLTDVAASANVRDGVTALDISDATGLGGSLQGGLRFNERDGGKIEARLHADHVNGQALGAAFEVANLLPNSTGSISVNLTGPGHRPADLLTMANGTITASFGKGTFDALNFDDFLQRIAAGGFFALSDVPASSFAVDGAELKASVAEGVAKLDFAEVRMPQRKLAVTGVVPLAGRGLALSGTVLSEQATNAGDPSTTRFFVGGSWDAPFVSPAKPKAPDE